MSIRSVASFIRWRLVPLRYLQTLSTNRRVARERWAMPSREMNDVQTRGYAPGPSLGPQALEAISAIYRPRTAEVQARTTGHPFVNLFRAEDIRADNPVVRFAFSEAVLGRAAEYFGNQVTLDSIQVLYSYPTEGAPRESQLWHKDYGDSRSLHCMTYLNDVQEPQDGPFAFVDRADSARIRRSPFVRRIDDAQFARELGDGEVRYFKGTAGTSVFVDPAACYHYGSRCRNPRLAIFVTFNTDRPFVPPIPLVDANAQALFDVAREVRPDLSERFLRTLLRLNG
ncbi:hypothetical protein CEG14_24845 [Bordetella genomosp. 1]|uniref:Phytanoyl-CoA dioxygenase n=1 Tax=Bordetella genomosp. 1 TaxID=1395607 RepID=A0A261RSW7_9BORD|nr:hypothetical protein [Bordetella genomosp. 1]OZI28144.1 hypothetical protein CEG14_24845 [Bordetella genomosp. 1]